jgi:hypothetical protein
MKTLNSFLIQGAAAILVVLTGQIGHAQTLFNDTFDTAGDANTYGWYYHGTNMTTSNTVSGGNLTLSNNGAVPGNNSGIWKSFGDQTLAAGETMRLTVHIAGGVFTSSPLGLSFTLVDSATVINANGGILSSTANPRYAYQLLLPRGTTSAGTGGVTAQNGIKQLYYAGAGTPAFNSQILSVTENSPNGAPDANNPTLPVTSTDQTFFTNGTYTSDAVLVWELSNVGGQMQFGGSFTAPNGGATTTFVTSDAVLFDHFTFDKVSIASPYWGTTTALNNVAINSVSMEIVPEPATWVLLAFGGLMVGVFLRRRRAI